MPKGNWHPSIISSRQKHMRARKANEDLEKNKKDKSIKKPLKPNHGDWTIK